MVTVIWDMYHIWYYGHYEKNVFGKSFRESLSPKGFVKNTPYLSIFTITDRQCLGWGCHGIYAAFCAYQNLKYIEKLEKKETSC